MLKSAVSLVPHCKLTFFKSSVAVEGMSHLLLPGLTEGLCVSAQNTSTAHLGGCQCEYSHSSARQRFGALCTEVSCTQILEDLPKKLNRG